MTEQVDIQKTVDTKVTVKFTLVKYYDETVNEVKTDRIIGKLSQPQIKELLKLKEGKFTFISREYEAESFEVDTIALYQLKK